MRAATWLTAVIAAVTGVVLWLTHTTAAHPPPSPAVFARSVPVRAADTQAGGWLGQQFRELAADALWLVPAGRSVLDDCSAGEPGSTGLAGGRSGYGPACQRTETRFYVYGDHGVPPVSRLERALRLLGWRGFAPAGGVGGPPEVHAQPGGSGAGPPAGKAGLDFSFTTDGRQFDPASAPGAVPPPVPPGRMAYLQVLRPSRNGIRSHLAAGRGSVLAVSITVTYATGPVPR